MLMQQTFRAEYNHYKMLLERSRDMKAKSEFCSNKSSSAINSRFDTELSGFGGGDGGNNGGGIVPSGSLHYAQHITENFRLS